MPWRALGHGRGRTHDGTTLMRSPDWTGSPASALPPNTAQLADLLDSLDCGERPVASTTDVRATIEFITCLYKSAATGRTVQRSAISRGDPYYHHVAGQALHETARRGSGA